MVLPRNLILFWLVGRTKKELSFNCQRRTVLLLSGNRGKNNINNKEKEQVKRPLEQPSVRLDLYPVFSQREEQVKKLIKQPDIEPGLYPVFSQREEQVKKLIKQPDIEPGLYPVFSQWEEQVKKLIKQPDIEPGLYPAFSQREEQVKKLIKQPHVEPGLYPVFSQWEEQVKKLIKQPDIEPGLYPVFSQWEEQVKKLIKQPHVEPGLYPVFSQWEEQVKKLIKQPDIEPGLYPAFSQWEEQVKKLIKQPDIEPGLYPVFSQWEEQVKKLIKQPHVEPGLYPVFSQWEEQVKKLIKQPHVEPGLYPVFSQWEEQVKKLIKQPHVEPSLNPVFSDFEITHSLNNNYKTKTNSKTEFLDSNKKNPKDLIFGKKPRHSFFPQKKSSYSSMLFCSQTLKDRFWSPLDVRTVHSIAPTSDRNQNLLLPNNTHCRGFHHIGASPSSSFSQASQLPSKRTQGLCVKKGVEKTPVCTPNVPFPSASSSHGYATSNNRDRGPHNRGWLTLEGYRIYPWSISGLETCIVLRSESDKKFSVTFDLGYSTRPSVRCQHVFISHGHMDHVAGLFQHATKRNLYNLPPATYYVPPNLVETLQRVGQMLYTLSSTPEILQRLDIRPIQPGDRVLVSPDYEVRPFATIHRVPSQGYLLYRRHKRLKRLYQHLTPEEVSEMQKQSKEEIFYDVSWIPDLAYTGDTTFELFLNSPPADLLKVRLLILEATYLESVTPGIIEKARERGHTHVAEIIENSHLFADVEKLLLIHLSDKYSSRFARDALAYQMTPDLLRKVVIATLAKDRS